MNRQRAGHCWMTYEYLRSKDKFRAPICEKYGSDIVTGKLRCLSALLIIYTGKSYQCFKTRTATLRDLPGEQACTKELAFLKAIGEYELI